MLREPSLICSASHVGHDCPPNQPKQTGSNLERPHGRYDSEALQPQSCGRYSDGRRHAADLKRCQASGTTGPVLPQ
jgi:hypothetical protein